MKNIDRIATSILLSKNLMERINTHLDSPVSGLKSRRELIEKAIISFLDREEIIASKLEKELILIKEKLG